MKKLFFVLSIISLNAMAIPELPLIDPMVRINNKADPEADYEGIIKLSNCSGSLITFKSMPRSKKALVMTNGHCIKLMRHGEFISNQPVTRKISVYDSSMNLHPLEVSRIVYATMTDTDIAFYELTQSYEEITAETNVEPYILENKEAPIPTLIDVISGYWEEVTTCETEAIIPLLKEGQWLWRNSIRYTKDCMTRGGFSGSPVIERGTRTVVGIHNTGNNGKTDCSDNNPCEVHNPQMETFRRYAQQAHVVYSCLNSSFEVDLTISGCDLPQGGEVSLINPEAAGKKGKEIERFLKQR